MKKAGALLAVGAAAGYGFYKFNAWLYNALLDRNFELPETLEKMITDSDEGKDADRERINHNAMAQQL